MFDSKTQSIDTDNTLTTQCIFSSMILKDKGDAFANYRLDELVNDSDLVQHLLQYDNIFAKNYDDQVKYICSTTMGRQEISKSLARHLLLIASCIPNEYFPTQEGKFEGWGRVITRSQTNEVENNFALMGVGIAGVAGLFNPPLFVFTVGVSALLRQIMLYGNDDYVAKNKLELAGMKLNCIKELYSNGELLSSPIKEFLGERYTMGVMKLLNVQSIASGYARS